MRKDLRLQTSALHRQVEEAFASFDLQSAEGSRDMVRTHIYAMNRLLPAFPADCPYGAEVDRLVRLVPANDPDILGLEHIEVELDTHSLHPLAVAYVVLGSRLGAQILSRGLAAAKEDIAPEVIAFLGDTQSIPVWKKLCDELASVASPEPQEKIHEDARKVFGLYEAAASQLNRDDTVTHV